MKMEEIKELCQNTTGLAHALEQEFGRQIPLTALAAPEIVDVDKQLLTTILEEYRELVGNQYSSDPNVWRYHRENMYIVWADGRIEKSDQVDYRCVATVTDDWSDTDLYSGDIDYEDEEILPIASHFVHNANITHLILLASSSRRLEGQPTKIETISIKVCTPPSGLDITATAKEIMDIWEFDGPDGLRDYLDDIDSGEDD